MLVSGDKYIDELFDTLPYSDIEAAYKLRNNIYLAVGKRANGELFVGTKLLTAIDLLKAPKVSNGITLLGHVDISSLIGRLK